MKLYLVEAEWTECLDNTLVQDEWFIIDTGLGCCLISSYTSGLEPLEIVKGTPGDEEDYWNTVGTCQVTYIGRV